MLKTKSTKIALSSTLMVGALFLVSIGAKPLKERSSDILSSCNNELLEDYNSFSNSKCIKKDSIHTAEDTINFIVESKKEIERKELEEKLAHRAEYERREKEKEEKRLAEERRLAKIEEERLAKLEKERVRRLKEKENANKTQIVSRGGGYQSNYEATFYTAFCPTGCIGITASGYNVSNTIYYQGMRVVAAPPNIPLHTKLRITFGDGSVMDAIVLDRGGDIQGKRLDILVSNRDEAYRMGRQQVKVEVIN